MLTDNKPIAVRLAKVSIALAFIVGLLLSAFQVYQDYIQENNALKQTAHQILKVAERSAVVSVQTLSEKIAYEVIEGILEYDFIHAVKIIDDQGTILAEKVRHTRDSQTQWLTQQIATPYQIFSIVLAPKGSQNQVLGQLSITVNLDAALTPFYSRFVLIFMNGIIRNLLLVLLLFIVFHIIITRPLVNMAHQFLTIDTHDIGSAEITFERGHSQDEIGQLTRSANHLFEKNREHLHQVKFAEEKYRAMFESSLIGMALNDKQGQLLEVNQAYLDITGYTEEEIYKLTFWDLTPSKYEEKEQIQLKSLKEKGRYGPYEKEYIHKNGHLVPVLLNGATILDSKNESYTWSFVQDISARKLAEEKLKLSSRVFSDTHEGITITDADKKIIDVNPAFSEITGYTREEVLGQNPSMLGSGKQNHSFYKGMWSSITKYGHWQGEVWNKKKSGEIYAQLITISSLTDENDSITNYVGVFTDITQSKAQQEKLQLMAHYDVLTKLPNRTLFADRFHQAIAHSHRTKNQFAICFLDLDNFKPINDTYGHEIGDKLLIEVAERLSSHIREEDTVSRQGGDEFLVLLNDIEDSAECLQTIERIHLSLAEPYSINHLSLKITASTGVTFYPSDDGDVDTLLRHADHALYQAKLAGKNRYQLFNPEDAEDTAKKLSRIDSIEQSLARGEFCLYYQPKVNMDTGDVFGAEALIRWNHPEKGLVPPLEFLPFIENSPLEIKVGNWVIDSAIQQIDTWQQQNIMMEVSINISSTHLLSPSFVEHLENVLDKYPSVDRQYIQFEVLESSALGDLTAISNVIKLCKEMFGISTALDDFGTGYSSLTHLRSLPASTIKIDQSFVRDMLDDPDDYTIIDGVISLANAFNREVIAEGVETTNHGLMLLVMGCKEAQGYGIAKPMPAAEIAPWLNTYTPNAEWLHCANNVDSKQERQIKLFRLVTQRWHDQFIAKVLSTSQDTQSWPIMDDNQCHCGTWLQRIQHEQLFSSEYLSKLSGIHEQAHVIANDLRKQKQKQNSDSIEIDLTEFESISTQIKAVLEEWS